MRAEGQCMAGGPLQDPGRVPPPTQPIHRDGSDIVSRLNNQPPRPVAPPRNATTGQIRAWAHANNIPCATRGALPAPVLKAWKEATQ